MKIETILTPAEIAFLPERPLTETTCVVFDILRATSTMITAFAHGAASIRPVRTIEEAHAAREASPDMLLAGERGGLKIDGFDFGNSPLEFTSLAGRDLVMTTTNGTAAFRAVAHAGRVLAGALLNMAALAEVVAGSRSVLLVAAGTGAGMALEDGLAAGMLAHALRESERDVECDDATLTAIALFEQCEPDFETAFRRSANGRALLARGFERDIGWCAQAFRYPVVAELREGTLLTPLISSSTSL